MSTDLSSAMHEYNQEMLGLIKSICDSILDLQKRVKVLEEKLDVCMDNRTADTTTATKQ